MEAHLLLHIATQFASSILSPREMQVLYLIAYEHNSKEIAKEMHISVETVHSHRKNIMIKLDVKNAAGMIRVAFERGLLHPEKSITQLPISQA